MKTLKISFILLALLLAAMVMVPLVSAIGQDVLMSPATDFANQTMDVTKIQIPSLNADSSQAPVTLTSELTLDQTIKSPMVASLAATPSSDAVKIPYGAIIRHSADGMTTVFDSTGKQLFSASDAKAAIIDTPNGPARATHVLEVPDKSVIIDAGQKMYVFKDKALLTTVIDETSHKQAAVSTAAASTYPSQYIEGTETNVLPNIGQFTARWNVPKSPVKTMAYPATGPSHLSSITIWNGVFGTVGSDTSSRLLQPVLEWYYKDKYSDPNPTNPAWTMATWYVWGSAGSESVHSIRRTLVYSGDTMQGNIEINKLGYYAIASITDLGPNGGGSSTLALNKTLTSKPMPYTNVQATVVLEGWDPTQLQGLSSDYLCGSTTFHDFVLKDSNGNTISTAMNSFINSNYWGTGTFGLNIANSWPSTIGLYTKNG
jgi:hypothetical protein